MYFYLVKNKYHYYYYYYYYYYYIIIIIIIIIITIVNTELRDQEAGFRKGQSCSDHTGTLQIVVDQSVE